MELIENGWFLEKNKQWPGQVFGLEVDKVLHSAKSSYQDILIFKRYLPEVFLCSTITLLEGGIIGCSINLLKAVSCWL